MTIEPERKSRVKEKRTLPASSRIMLKVNGVEKHLDVAWTQKYQSQTANLSAVKIHYLKAGTGNKTLVLIHGFGDTSHMWIPLFDEFGKDYTIIAPDMRGLGESSRPMAGYDKKTIASDIHELVK